MNFLSKSIEHCNSMFETRIQITSAQENEHLKNI